VAICGRTFKNSHKIARYAHARLRMRVIVNESADGGRESGRNWGAYRPDLGHELTELESPVNDHKNHTSYGSIRVYHCH
jgi:hypothetical protein